MRLCAVSAMAFVVTAGLAVSAPSAKALSFSFDLDDTFDTTVTPPFVGTGTFSFDEILGDGTYALSGLTNVDFAFNFVGGDVFDETHIDTPLSEILIIISKAGQQVNFSNTSPFGSGFGGGSIDFFNPLNANLQSLSFEPPGFNGGLNAYFASGTTGDTFAGTYAEPVPTPALLPGLMGMGIAALRRKKQLAEQTAVSGDEV
jgi:hypothetical protein